MLTPQQTAFLQSASQAAIVAEKATACPAELSVAQCAIESGWGKSSPGNNCFGIKASDTHETYQLTKEYLNGQWQTMRLAFEAYDSLADCFIAHAKLIQGGRYSDAWREYEQDRDLDNLIRGIAHIYATAPGYATEILSLAHNAAVTAAIAKAQP
jgi:flagellum-specific peptidoglycan hydrolase FlgJ